MYRKWGLGPPYVMRSNKNDHSKNLEYSLFRISAVAATGGPGGPWPPHFLLRWNLRMCILLFFVSMYLWIFVHNLRYKGLLLGVSKALWDAQFYLSSKHSGADFKFYRISGPPTQILAPRPLYLEVYEKWFHVQLTNFHNTAIAFSLRKNSHRWFHWLKEPLFTQLHSRIKNYCRS